MQIGYTYKQDGKFLIGHMDEYPEYPTQAFSIDELEANLQDIYEMINNGTRHDIYKHKETGKMIPVPRHSEFSNEFLKDILKEIPKN